MGTASEGRRDSESNAYRCCVKEVGCRCERLQHAVWLRHSQIEQSSFVVRCSCRIRSYHAHPPRRSLKGAQEFHDHWSADTSAGHACQGQRYCAVWHRRKTSWHADRAHCSTTSFRCESS